MDSIAASGVRLLLFTPPYHPLVYGSDSADFNGTGHDDYREMVNRLEALAARHDSVVFLDVHRGGEHGFSHEDFANPDHLHESGAEKLTARLVEAIASP